MKYVLAFFAKSENLKKGDDFWKLFDGVFSVEYGDYYKT